LAERLHPSRRHIGREFQKSSRGLAKIKQIRRQSRVVALEIFVTYLSPLMPLHHAAGIGGT
jgi:hypothetical protein